MYDVLTKPKQSKGFKLDRAHLMNVPDTSDKGRSALSEAVGEPTKRCRSVFHELQKSGEREGGPTHKHVKINEKVRVHKFALGRARLTIATRGGGKKLSSSNRDYFLILIFICKVKIDFRCWVQLCLV